MSHVRTIHKCDMCQRQYAAIKGDPAPSRMHVALAAVCLRTLYVGETDQIKGEACATCQAKLRKLIEAAWDAMLVAPPKVYYDSVGPTTSEEPTAEEG